MAEPNAVTKLKQPAVIIRTDKEARSLQPRLAKYQAKVEGITGLRLIIKPDGKKNWEAVFKVNGKAKTYAYGTYPGIKLNEAIRRATDDYAQIKQGNDPSSQKRLAKQQAMSANRADTSIAELAEERTRHLRSAGKLSATSAELDQLYIRKLSSLIGRKSFTDLSHLDLSLIHI